MEGNMYFNMNQTSARPYIDGDDTPLFLEFAKPKPKPEVPTDSLLRAPGAPTGNPVMDERLRLQRRTDFLERVQLRKLTELTERTGMPVTQENGQRRYGPPLEPEVPIPPRGSEVFVGKVPRDCYEPELVPIFEKVGRIYEMRLMMDFSGTNRGYCFVHYFTPYEAERAIRELNGYEIRPRRRIGVVKSIDNCRLYIGNIPKDKGPEEIRQEVDKLTEGVVKIVCPNPGHGQLNRGYAFIEYESHRAAAMARRKFVPGKLQMWNTEVTVDWAEPETEIQTLFVKNVSLTTSEQTLFYLFNEASQNGVQNVKKIRDYAFVELFSHHQAEMAKLALDNSIIENSQIMVHWGRRGGHPATRERGNKFRVEFDFKPPTISAAAYQNLTVAFNGASSCKPKPRDNFFGTGSNGHARIDNNYAHFNSAGNRIYANWNQTQSQQPQQTFGFGNHQMNNGQTHCQNPYSHHRPSPYENLNINAEQRSSGLRPEFFGGSPAPAALMNYNGSSSSRYNDYFNNNNQFFNN